MRRALELAAHGEGYTSPNPMVGAVIVTQDGRIIGEGYHRRCGEGHAEVNAINSVAASDRPLLQESTIYVTLEPCSHYGKTPPCAKLIIETGIPRVVVGAVDPFKEVAGRGIEMLRNAGVEVVHGILAEESRKLNRKFFTAHQLQRPFVTLKWAQSSDGFMSLADSTPCQFSDSPNSMLVHRLRSLHDAIIVGAGTAITDNPRLDCRLWPGRSPVPVVPDTRGTIDPSTLRMHNPIIISDRHNVADLLSNLYSRGITSVLVEGGPSILKSFITANLWDEARVETAFFSLNSQGGNPAPQMPIPPCKTEQIGSSIVNYFVNDCSPTNL